MTEGHPPSTPASASTTSTNTPRDWRWLLRLWFGLSEPVDQRRYMRSGFGLMVLKYAMDAAAIYVVTGRLWTGLDYLSPFFATRAHVAKGDHQLLMGWLVASTLPFIWIGASMSVRRAVDAGLRPGTGLYFFVPVVNYLFMLLLCVLPSRANTVTPPRAQEYHRLRSALLGVAAGVGIAVTMVGFSVFVVGKYAGSLFVGTPFLVGAASAYLFNQQAAASMRATIALASLSVSIAGAVLLLFAMEGVVCLAMAFPLALFMAAFGAALGRAVALTLLPRMAPLISLLALLPLMTGAERAHNVYPLREVVSTIEIDAPPERVWPNVVGFSELPPPPEWFFRLGIAHPVRARIDGHGVGAVRYCEFSTGPFVEPITRWEEPNRLSFDVRDQPPTMKELSPYAVVNAPHLDNYLRSKKGEFRLVALPGGRTRVEGSTWYEVDIFPQGYWTLWSDALIHAIHARVLQHVKTLSERPL